MARRRNRRRRGAALFALALAILVSLLAGALAPSVGRAQSGSVTTTSDGTDAMSRALAAEEKGDARAASIAYREVLVRAMQAGESDGDRIAIALLGLERVWAELGVRDSILPVVQRVLQLRPADPTARGIQLRTLINLGRHDEARLAFLAWRRSAASDGAPVREYARLLLAAGRAAAADSLLTEAGRLLGPAGQLSGEVAQLHVALERWNAAAVAFREALVDQPYLETAALFALQRTPEPARDSIRAVLHAPPAALGARRLLASLELSWGEPRRAWAALSSVKADDSTAAAWRAFGERAEMAAAWPVARDVWTAVFDKRGDVEAQTRAASAALRAGDAAGALALARREGKGTPTERIGLVAAEIAALGDLGRAAEAQARLDGLASQLDETTRSSLSRPLVSVWLRAGDLARARAAIAGTDLAEDDETIGWLALYDGDLVTARKRLVRADTRRAELVDALGLLARTRAERSTELGAAFLLIARRDSAGAAARLVALADSTAVSSSPMSDAAPALLGLAARLRSPGPEAIALWTRIVSVYPKSPEAPESLLAWARVLAATKDRIGAMARLETLILEYPGSALLPQARRELERLRAGTPPV